MSDLIGLRQHRARPLVQRRKVDEPRRVTIRHHEDRALPGAAGALLVRDDLRHHRCELAGGSGRESAHDRQVRKPIVIGIDEPVVRGRFHRAGLDDPHRHVVNLSEAVVVARILRRVPDEEQETWRRAPVPGRADDEIADRVRRLPAKLNSS